MNQEELFLKLLLILGLIALVMASKRTLVRDESKRPNKRFRSSAIDEAIIAGDMDAVNALFHPYAPPSQAAVDVAASAGNLPLLRQIKVHFGTLPSLGVVYRLISLKQFDHAAKIMSLGVFPSVELANAALVENLSTIVHACVEKYNVCPDISALGPALANRNYGLIHYCSSECPAFQLSNSDVT